MKDYHLVFAWGPTPKEPLDARMLGAEEATLGHRLDETPGAFRIWVHRAAVPELVAYVRARGRDCAYRPFAERQALLIVEARR